MTPRPYTPEIREAVGKFCVNADWACTHGDFSTLGYVAQQLADYLPEPIHCELLELAAACRANPDLAEALWERLKDQLYCEARA